ncbi:hypothetical protein [Rubrobacter taiwanensis]|nr:hypothetical protein [Rubrobacter taiwanensis]
MLLTALLAVALASMTAFFGGYYLAGFVGVLVSLVLFLILVGRG